MNLFTLALRNIKLNLKKYIMYLFSLSFSVFTAYSFLALMQNDYVMMAFTYDTRYRSMLSVFGVIIMVFVMFFLISSNNSFIRARKKEISTYALFGMTNGRIGKLIFLETMIVGFVTLVLGIGSGIFFSKLIAMILLDISLAAFTGDIAFSIDPRAIYITVLIFSSIFCLLGLSGLRVINKFELVDLFKADKVSEGRSEGSILALIISLLLIGAGYFIASNDSVYVVSTMAIPIIALVVAGTYLFFWGGLPKVLSLMKRNKSRYYQGVNLISTAAFSHRVKSIASVMATIAILSAVATTALATGFTLYRNVEKNTYDIVGWDMYFYGGQEEVIEEIYESFEKHNTEIRDIYTTQRYTARPMMKPIVANGRVQMKVSSREDYFRVYSESVYNKLVSLSKTNLSSISVKLGEATYLAGHMTKEFEKQVIGHELIFNTDNITITSMEKNGTVAFGAIHTLVLNDEDFLRFLNRGDIVDKDISGKPYDEATVINYDNPLAAHKLNTELNTILYGKVGGFRSAYNHYNESLETFGLVCFIGFFMSAVFILMTASLLYFKQIMVAEEEEEQYNMLRKIGMDSQVEEKVIRRRLMPVFFIPLFVGIIHSIFAMKTADTMVFSNMIPVENTFIIVLAFSAVMYVAYAFVYGIFYVITKEQYSRIVKRQAY